MKKLCIFSILLIMATVFASFEAVCINPNSVRIGNICGFKKGDVLIPYMNYTSGGVTANYMIPFGLTELSMQEVSYSGRMWSAPFILYASNFGNGEYRENTVGVSAKVYSAKDMSVYPALKFFNMKNVLGNELSFGADINAEYSLSEKLNTVLSVINIYAYETDELDIPMIMCINFEYSGIEFFNLYSGVEKDSRNSACFKTGLEYVPFTFFSVSAGYNFDPELITSGFSLEYNKFSFNYGMSYHFDLEYSHSFGLVYEF